MNKIFLIAVCSILILACKSNKKEITDLNQEAPINNLEIDSLMQTCFKRGLFNGNILVLKNDSIIYKNSLGFSDSLNTKKLNQNKLFNIGSIAKEFSAVAIMKLVEKDKVNLNEVISKYLPNLPKWSEKIRVKNLLDYTSGLPRYNWETIRTDKDIYTDLINIKTLEAEPGDKQIYSNNNVLLRKLIIEKISGIPFNNYIDKNIFEPLEMNNTFLTPIQSYSKIAQGYSATPTSDKQTAYDQIFGAVFTTTDDMNKWIVGLHSEKIISNKSKNVLNTPFTFENYSETALGAPNLENGEMVRHQHSGSHMNYESLIDYNLNNGLIVILFTNTAKHKLWKIDHAINAIVHHQPYSIPEN